MAKASYPRQTMSWMQRETGGTEVSVDHCYTPEELKKIKIKNCGLFFFFHTSHFLNMKKRALN